MSLSRRLQNLIVDNRFTGAKELFSIDLTHQLFGNIATHPSTIRDASESGVVVQTPVADSSNHQKNKQAEAAVLQMERIQLHNPTLTFQAFSPALNEPCKVHCFPLGGGKLLWADQLGRSFVFDVEMRQMEMMPSLHVPKWMPFSVFVPYAGADASHGYGHDSSGNRLFIMERIPKPEAISSTQGSFQFEAVVCKPTVFSGINTWQCQLLPPPPYVHEPDYRDCYSHREISSYAVIRMDGCFHICISVNGIGTYCLDTASHIWRKVGNWTLPFHGRVDYVPEFKLWFGLTSEPQDLAAADLTAIDSQPQLVGSWKPLFLPEEWKECKDSQLVNLGSGRFCITRFLHTRSLGSSVGDIDNYITLFTGVEVLPQVQDANGDNGEVELQMISHKSLCYKSDGSTIDVVF